MSHHLLCAVISILVLLGTGCKREAEQSTAATRPAPQASAAPDPVVRLTVADEAMEFRDVHVELDRSGDEPLLVISAEGDPSLYFELPVEPADDGELVDFDQRWPDRERRESLVGIRAGEWTYQPVALRAVVRAEADEVVWVDIRGTFSAFRGDSLTPLRAVDLQTQFRARVRTAEP